MTVCRSNEFRSRRAVLARVSTWLLATWLAGAPIGRATATAEAHRIPAIASPAGGAPAEARATRASIEIDGDATAPVFLIPSTNPFGLSDVGAYAAPGFVDVDGDGDLDAFVGNSAGEVRFFRNTGTPTSPAFASPSLQPFGLHVVTYDAVPRFEDIDGDGDFDAFLGSEYGDVVFFRNTGSASSPAFLDAGFNPLGITNVGDYSSPALGDIDGDGDLDLLVGSSSGDSFFFGNTGTSSSPAFAAGPTNPFGMSNVTAFAAPTLVDLDGDGDLDALVWNEAGDSLFFANTGAAASPAFASPASNRFGLTNVGGSGVAAFADIDGDGDLDAFVGNAAGQIVFFRNLTAQLLFEDGFESGDTSAWTITTP